LGGNQVTKILVIGDVIEDVIVIPESEIRPNTDTKSAIHKSMGGQAANVASWLAFLGVQTRFVGCVSFTDVRKLDAELGQNGIESALQSSAKPTGSLVVLVQGDSRSMLTDRGANLDLNLRAIDPSGFAAVYLSGYSLLGRGLDEIKDFAARVRQAGAVLAIDPGSYGFIEDHGVEEFKELISEADLIFPNLEEDQLLGLSGVVALNVVTKGQNGAQAHWANGQSVEVAGLETESIDPTGAGDAFCAGFLARLVAGEDFQGLGPEMVQMALKSGVEAGSKAVQLVGARPSFNSGV
jgi:sugar/nucleoside kinase (ribokinase family)